MQILEHVQRWTRACALALVAMAALNGAQAQDKPVLNIIVPYPAGGPSDTSARRLAPELSKQLGQTVIVQNIGGAGGAIAAQKVLQSSPDGLTLMYASPNEVILVPAINPNAKYKSQDFTPIGFATQTPMMVVARTSLPVNNIDELIQYGKSTGRELTYGSVGAGSFQHILGTYLASQTKLNMIHVPYKGGAPLNNDILGQQVDLMVTSMSAVHNFVEAGKMHALGMMTKERSPLMPGIPTVNEGRSLKGMDFWLWAGLVAPANTPLAVQERLNKAFNQVIILQSVRDGIAASGGEPQPPMGLQELRKLYQSDAKRYPNLVKALNIRIEN
ncbi:tripartite tricarboxylate transporter substrate binding protein [Polaromonas sp. P1(28)-13]|nr:tripartite tricarboxylate transporter substrate binding protein [Polaromonas sp. P1(28)-13]